MALVKFDPFVTGWIEDLAGINRQMAALTQQVFGRPGEESTSRGNMYIPVDVLTRGEDLVVRAELPGIDPAKDVEVIVDKHMLTVRGERRFEETRKGDRYHRVERSYGSFSRTIALPESVTEGDIQARYENGVLEVVVPTAARQQVARKVPVQIGSDGEAEAAAGAEVSGAEETEPPAAS